MSILRARIILFILESTDPSVTSVTEQVPGKHSFNKHGLLPAGDKVLSKSHKGPESKQADNHTREISPPVRSGAGMEAQVDGSLSRELLWWSPVTEPLGVWEEGRQNAKLIGSKNERKGAGGGWQRGGGRGRRIIWAMLRAKFQMRWNTNLFR